MENPAFSFLFFYSKPVHWTVLFIDNCINWTLNSSYRKEVLVLLHTMYSRWKVNYPCLDLTGISPNSCRAQENGLFSASTMNFCRMNSIKSVFSYKILVGGHFTTFKSVKLICTIKQSLEKLFSTMYMYYEINQSH